MCILKSWTYNVFPCLSLALNYLINEVKKKKKKNESKLSSEILTACPQFSSNGLIQLENMDGKICRNKI